MAKIEREVIARGIFTFVAPPQGHELNSVGHNSTHWMKGSVVFVLIAIKTVVAPSTSA